MNGNIWYIIGGFLLVSAVGFGLVTAYTMFFLKYGLKKKDIFKKIWLPIATLAVTWVAVTMLSVMLIASYGVLPFALTLTLLLLGFSYLLSRKILGLTLKQGIFYSIGFSAIINPIWYFLF